MELPAAPFFMEKSLGECPEKPEAQRIFLALSPM
jgi:hypothetical protein